jgi:tellurite resistance protein TerC
MTTMAAIASAGSVVGIFGDGLLDVDAPAPFWLWASFVALVVVLLAVDLLAHRKERPDSKKIAVAWTAGWIACALAFNLFVAVTFGAEAGEQFLGAYALEKSLSVDNLFVFLIVFKRIGVPLDQERRVLSWGILGALVTRGIFIAIGAELLERWHAIVYVFGAVLIFSGLKMLRTEGSDEGAGWLMPWLQRKLPYSAEAKGPHFFVREAGKLLATPLMVALIAVELTDVVFAVDSIPAAFAVTERPFIVYTSNIFAVLGLRSLYMVLARSLEHLKYLHFGLAAVLVFAGVKMVGSCWVHVSPLVSLGIIALSIGIAVVASVVHGRRARRASPPLLL